MTKRRAVWWATEWTKMLRPRRQRSELLPSAASRRGRAWLRLQWLFVATALIVVIPGAGRHREVLNASVSRGSAVGVRASDFNAYGVNNDMGLINYSVENLSGRQAHALMRDAGVGWVRYWLSWQQVEGTPGAYDWSRSDHDITAAIEEGLNVYVTVQTAPAWAHNGKGTYHWGGCGVPGSQGAQFDPTRPGCGDPNGPNPFEPFDPGGGNGQSFYFQRFVRAAVARYGDRVKYWGFWNEPNLQWMWPEWPTGQCQDRAVQLVEKVLKPGREAALQANPSVVIVGPEENSEDFLGSLLRLERDGKTGTCFRPPYGRLFDVISIHSYSWAGQGGVPAHLDRFKTVLDQYDRREVWLTETDGNTNLPTPLNELRMRGWLSKLFVYRMRADLWVHPDTDCGVGNHLFLLDRDLDRCQSYFMLYNFTRANPPSAHFAGTTNAGGHQDFVLLQNPHGYTVPATVKLSTSGGAPINQSVSVPPNSRFTLFVGSPGWGGQEQAVSIIPSNPWLPLWAEHADRWNNTFAGRASQGAVEKSDTWYFAEGSTSPPGGFWVEDIVAYNPSDTDNVQMTWTYLNASGSPTSTNWIVPPRGHRRMRTSDVAGVQNDHSTIVSGVWASGSHNGHPAPIAAERTISWGGNMDGHASKGVPYAATTWYFAEGSQDSAWATYLLLMNPSFRPASVQVEYLLPSGFSGAYYYTVPARSRWTVSPPANLGSFGIKVSSVGASPVPIVAERSMYGGNWAIGTNGEGATAPSQRWIFSEGSTEGSRYWVPFFLVANPTTVGGNVRVRFRRTDGTVVDYGPFLLSAGQRVTIDPWAVSTALQNWSFATEVIVESAAVANQPPPGVVAERVMYWDGTTGLHSGHVVLGTP